MNKYDSLTLEKYKYEIQKQYIEDVDSLTREQVDSIFFQERMSFADSKVVYSPDSYFKIFVIEVESCGAYCNSEWYSWIHFNLNKKEIIQKADFTTIDSIYNLPDRKYLLIEKSWARPASVMTVFCLSTRLISFSADSMTIHPIKYRQQNYFSFCQENGTETGKYPFIIYDKNKKLLTYYYGNNYSYSNGADIDTIRQGQFKYIKGQFLLDKESIRVNNQEIDNN